MITWNQLSATPFQALFDALEKGTWSATATELTFVHGSNKAIFHGAFTSGGTQGTITGFDGFVGATEHVATTGYSMSVPDFWNAEARFALLHDLGNALWDLFLAGPVTINDFGGDGVLVSGEFADRLFGNGGNDTLVAGSGVVNDFLDGGKGADQMAGQLGDDTYVVDDPGDVVSEPYASGTDLVRSSISFSLSDATHAKGDLENLTLVGPDDIDASGNGLANILVGNSADNTIDGRGGADIMRGGDGDDTYIVDDLGDVVDETGTSGIDTIRTPISFSLSDVAHSKGEVDNLVLTGLANIDATGNEFANAIVGNEGNNQLAGLGGKDFVSGGAGEDELSGGLGKDKLIGGKNADTFVFDAELRSKNADKIMDFTRKPDPISRASDIIALDHDVFGELNPGALKKGYFHAGATAQDHNDFVIYDQDTGTLFYDADGSGGAGQVKIANIFDHNKHHPHIDASDLLVI